MGEKSRPRFLHLMAVSAAAGIAAAVTDNFFVSGGIAAAAVVWSCARNLKITRNRRLCRWLLAPAAFAAVMAMPWYLQHRERTYVIGTEEYSERTSRNFAYTAHEGRFVYPDPSGGSLQIQDNFPRLDSATSLGGLCRAFAEAAGGEYNYHSGWPSSHVAVSRTPAAYENLISGKADLIFAFRPSAEQTAAAAAQGWELRITPIALDGFVFFVSRENPVDSLTVQQLRDIYSGRLTNWRDAGGEDAAVLPYQRFAGSGSQSQMERFMAGDTLLDAPKEIRITDMEGIVRRVARYHNYRAAIGYSFLYYVEKMLEGGGVKILRADGVMPSAETIRNRSYPLTEEICVITAGSENPHLEAFIAWILSPEGQRIAEQAGYVPLR